MLLRRAHRRAAREGPALGLARPGPETLLLIGFTGPLFFLFVLTQTASTGARARPLLLLATFVGISSFGANALGFERRGIGLLLSFPVARWKVLVAKNLAAILFRLPSFFDAHVAALGLASPALPAGGPDRDAGRRCCRLRPSTTTISILFPVAVPAPGQEPVWRDSGRRARPRGLGDGAC